jgi:hypothetical protein
VSEDDEFEGETEGQRGQPAGRAVPQRDPGPVGQVDGPDGEGDVHEPDRDDARAPQPGRCLPPDRVVPELGVGEGHGGDRIEVPADRRGDHHGEQRDRVEVKRRAEGLSPPRDPLPDSGHARVRDGRPVGDQDIQDPVAFVPGGKRRDAVPDPETGQEERRGEDVGQIRVLAQVSDHGCPDPGQYRPQHVRPVPST